MAPSPLHMGRSLTYRLLSEGEPPISSTTRADSAKPWTTPEKDRAGRALKKARSRSSLASFSHRKGQTHRAFLEPLNFRTKGGISAWEKRGYLRIGLAAADAIGSLP